MFDLGKLLRELRGKESLRDAARRAGISHNYLSIVEKGVDPRSGSPVKASPETLKSLAKAYNYSYLELMYAAGYVDEAEGMAGEMDNITDAILGLGELEGLINKYTDDEIIELYSHSSRGKKLNEDQVRKILSYVRFVLKSTHN